MYIIDFLITDNQNIKLDDLTESSKGMYIDKTINFRKIKIGRFFLYYTYLGKFEELKKDKDQTKLIIGNVLAFNNHLVNIDTIQNDYINNFKNNIKEIDIVRNILGPSIRVNINNQIITFTTDLVSTIPIFFHTMGDGTHIFSSHINFIKKLVPKLILDNTSVVEFLTSGKVSFPYTIYNDVAQLSPASINFYDSTKSSIKKNTYWRPNSNDFFETLDDASNTINKAIHQNIKLFMEKPKKHVILMSGGEDSRLLACIMRKYGEFDGYIILDEKNREYELALKASQNIGFNLSLILRSGDFYFDILSQATKISGNNSQYMHLHVLHKELIDKFNDQKSVDVTQGYFSDVLLKGSRINVSALWRKFGILIKTNHLKQTNLNPKTFKVFKKKYFEKLKERRKLLKKNDFYSGLPEDSEYFNFLPITNYKSCAQSIGQRRIINLFDPFLSNEIVYLSCKVPETYKLNRRLFNSIYKKNCLKVKFLGHTDGRIPFFNYKINIFIRPLILFYRWLTKKDRNEGPWTNFIKFSQKKIVNYYLHKEEHSNIIEISENSSYNKFVKDKTFMNSKMTSLLQIINILRND